MVAACRPLANATGKVATAIARVLATIGFNFI
jgi:hypothetical protein